MRLKASFTSYLLLHCFRSQNLKFHFVADNLRWRGHWKTEPSRGAMGTYWILMVVPSPRNFVKHAIIFFNDNCHIFCRYLQRYSSGYFTCWWKKILYLYLTAFTLMTKQSRFFVYTWKPFSWWKVTILYQMALHLHARGLDLRFTIF